MFQKASQPTQEDFQNVLNENVETFHRCRTAEILEDHWKLLRHYHLLSCQTGIYFIHFFSPVNN